MPQPVKKKTRKRVVSRRSPRKIVRLVTKEPWCIVPERLEQITELLELRANGREFTEDEVAERIGRTDRDSPSQITDDGIQVIDVFGVLAPRMDVMTRISGGTSMQTLRKTIDSARTNSKVKTVILRVESPGGTYIGAPEVREALIQLKNEKRVVTSAENEFASGGYWIGSTAHEVYATTSTPVGSIGVFSVHVNNKEAAEKSGQKFKVFKGGKFKAALHPLTEWTKDEIEHFEARTQDIYDQFVDAVAENRDVSKAEVKERFGEGSTVFGEEAKARGMIDGVATFDEVLARERSRLQKSSSSTSFVTEKEDEMKVTAKIKSQLFARGLVSDLDASDEVCVVAMQAFAAGVGEEINDDTTEDEALAMLRKEPAKALVAVGEISTELVSTEDETPAVDASAVRAMAAAMPHVSDEMALDAIESLQSGEQTMDEVTTSWVEAAANSEGDVRIANGASQYEKFSRGAVSAMIESTGDQFSHLVDDEDRQYAASLSNLSTNRIAEEYLRQTGTTDNEIRNMNNEDIAQAFIRGGGETDKQRLPDLVASVGTVNYSGDHPHLVDQLANKVLWKPYPIASYKYRMWAGRLDSVKNFDPHGFAEVGIFDGMDLFTETENETKELKFHSASKTYYSVDRFRNKVGLTVEMVVGDKLGGFMRQLRTMADLPEKTLNRMCIALLKANPTMYDGNKLFSAEHGNIVSPGTAVSSASVQAMINMQALQEGFDGEEMDISPTRSLHPQAQSEAAKQTLMRSKYDPKVANQDTDINTVRDEITPIIDARFDRYSTAEWYTLLDPALMPVIGFAHMQGYGEKGRREVEYNKDSTKRFYHLEARFGAAAVDWRGMILNEG